ncbi:hypothetical protein QQ045_008786 [Rhodiola kirilowii]
MYSSMGNKPESSLYEVLRIKRNASLIDIKKAYRNLAKLYHPDSLSDQADSRNFMAIRDAYATLSDPTARALYDLSIGVGQRSGLRVGNFAGSGLSLSHYEFEIVSRLQSARNNPTDRDFNDASTTPDGAMTEEGDRVYGLDMLCYILFMDKS